MTELFKKKMLWKNNSLFVRMLLNMTTLLQPLDLTVSSSFKALVKKIYRLVEQRNLERVRKSYTVGRYQNEIKIIYS